MVSSLAKVLSCRLGHFPRAPSTARGENTTRGRFPEGPPSLKSFHKPPKFIHKHSPWLIHMWKLEFYASKGLTKSSSLHHSQSFELSIVRKIKSHFQRSFELIHVCVFIIKKSKKNSIFESLPSLSSFCKSVTLPSESTLFKSLDKLEMTLNESKTLCCNATISMK